MKFVHTHTVTDFDRGDTDVFHRSLTAFLASIPYDTHGSLEALEQIDKMGYAKPYVADKRKVICIGVSFSFDTRTVEDWEEIVLM